MGTEDPRWNMFSPPPSESSAAPSAAPCAAMPHRPESLASSKPQGPPQQTYDCRSRPADDDSPKEEVADSPKEEVDDSPSEEVDDGPSDFLGDDVEVVDDSSDDPPGSLATTDPYHDGEYPVGEAE